MYVPVDHMSNNEDMVKQATDKAWQGARLLAAGDFVGAIAACAEAIKLNPSSVGARRTRAEAYQRLGKGIEAEADLNHLKNLRETAAIRERDEKGDPQLALCARLRSFGVDARPGTKSVHGSGVSEWLIDITEGPISQVLIWENFDQAMSEGPDSAKRGIAYFGPDSIQVGVQEWSEIGRGISGYISSGIADAVGEHLPSRREWDSYQSQARELPATELSLKHQAAEAACAALRDIGVDSSVPEQDPFTAFDGLDGWVQIAEGPKRWLGQYALLESDQPYYLYVPDSRIEPKFPKVAIITLVEVAQTLEDCLRLAASRNLARQDQASWVVDNHGPGTNEEFSLVVAEQLTKCRISRDNTISVLVRSDPDRGCWTLMRVPIADIRDEPVARPIWDFCKEVAEALLAMPLPIGK